MAGQFDKYLQQQILEAGVQSDAVEPSTLSRGPIIRPGAVAAPGLALDGGSPLVRGTDTGGPANSSLPANSPKGAAKRTRGIKSAVSRAAFVENVRKSGKEQRENLATTTMRMVNGQPIDMDEFKPPKAKPVSNLLSKGSVTPNTSAKPDDWQGDNPLSADDAARMMDPGAESRNAKYAADAATESTRQDMLSGERAFNESQAKSGGNLRSVNGITYDVAELEASRKKGLTGDVDGGFSANKYRAYEKERDSVDSILDGRAKFVPSTGKKNIKKDTKNAQANGVTEESVIPKSPYTKQPVDPANQDDYRPSSIVPTAPQLEDLGNSDAVENKDVDNYDASKKEGTIKQTTTETAGGTQTVTAKKKTDIKEDPDYQAEQRRLAADKAKAEDNEDTKEDQELTAQGQADVKKTRAEKGQRNAKPVKVDSRTVPFDQQDLWDAEGNVRPEYQDGPSSTTMVAKKNWDIQPIYKSPELQAKHEKRQDYSARVESSILDSLNKHIDTDYASPEESRAAFATLQKKHAKLHADVDKYHPVPEGGYFNDQEDTSSTSYEEMPGVKTLPKTQPQNVKDDSNVVPERYLNDIDTTSDAQLAVDDRNASRSRTSVAATSSTSRTRQMDYNKIATPGTRGRTPEQEMTDLINASERNQKLESQGKRLQTHSPEVMLRARLSADDAGVSPAVYNSPIFHQLPEGRMHVRDAYLRQSAQIGDDAESEEKMAKFAGGNATEANNRKDAAYTFLQNRERFNNSKEPGTGYRYNPGLGNLDIKSDSFRASNGSIVPMSQTDHPEHPGFDLEGSHVGFKGSVPNGENADGTPSYRPLTHPQTKEDLHEGWHPYKVNGQRVFEKHSIPENAIHHADIVEQAIQNGEPPSATLRKLEQGKESSITANGLAITAQPAAPIKGAGGFDPKPLPAGPDFSGVPMSENDPVPNPLYGDDKKRYRRAAAHAKHEETGTIADGCRACSVKASQASRDNHANIAGTFMPPTPRRGRVGTGAPVTDGELPTRAITEAEKEGKAAIPTYDDSKSKVFTDIPKKSGDALAQVARDTRASLGHPELEDIAAAHALGSDGSGNGITGDEAYELAVNAGHFPGAKPKFTKVEE